MISLATADELLDLNAVIGNAQRAHDQLTGAVALHNILERRGIAYLADEVGMGKTYVALSVLALVRHFKPSARVLIIAPRQNIQLKWQKELRLFVRNNVKVSDLRVRSPDGTPVRPLVHCRNLIELIQETALDPDRDFFARMPSFSLPLSDSPERRRGFRDRLYAELPWLPPDFLDLRSTHDIKERFAQALNSALPPFDLVVVDEAHNLKHGFVTGAASRNLVLATALGHPRVKFDRRLKHTGSRAGKILLLSATPIDDDYAQLWRQLDLFGHGERYRALRDPDADEDAKRAAVADVLVRRVTTLRVAGRRLTKNLYRREWRHGGVQDHDDPLPEGDDRQQLTVALVQKKVSELLDHEQFGASFQIGMLASFESFLETTGATLTADEDGRLDEANFDGAEQADDEFERQGVDVPELNGLATNHRRIFHRELPHPKMDALVQRLSTTWYEGRKELVFVRRVASVDELKRRVEDEYDRWLLQELISNLPARHHAALNAVADRYRDERQRRYRRRNGRENPDDGELDPGGVDSFFSYFFRGQGPPGIVSGARVQQRFQAQGSRLATFFADNYVMSTLSAQRGRVLSSLAHAVGLTEDAVREEVRERSRQYLSGAKVAQRASRFAAAQAAALELLSEVDATARVAYDELFLVRRGPAVDASAAPEILDETETLFTALRARPEIRERIWPQSELTDPRQAFREEFLRAQLLSGAARLGHAFIDLWTLIAAGLTTITDSGPDQEEQDLGSDVIAAYIDLLERQAATPRHARRWCGLDELEDLSQHHALILDVNISTDQRDQGLAELTRAVGLLLTAQRPVAGMSGVVTPRLVRQFRMPGYPLVMISTDLLQEGEDLHTFCSTVHHYGLAWTPSALEQRTGRIDRVRSQSERRLTALSTEPRGEDKLQVHYPHLAETIERLQVRRVLQRGDEFIRLMHTDLAAVERGRGQLNINEELLSPDARIPPPPAGVLRSAFDVRDQDLRGRERPLLVDARVSAQHLHRFSSLSGSKFKGVSVDWELPQPSDELLIGTAQLPRRRIQPFSLRLGWWEGHLIVRCISPVGVVDVDANLTEIEELCRRASLTLGLVPLADDTYNLTVEEDVLLGSPAHDRARVGALVSRVTSHADELEYRHIPDRDQQLHEFRAAMIKDVRRGR